ncbi:MAG: magnesium/cobalt transporter CorA [Candidatus Aquicultor sp.]
MKHISKKKRSAKAGLPPGSLVHIGDKKSGEVKITILDYDEHSFSEREATEVKECFPFRDTPTVSWINLEGIHDTDILEKLGECYGLHPLVLEDILNTDQRPKFEDYRDYVYIVLKMIYYDNVENGIVTEQISLILGKNYVLSFQEGIEGDIFDPIRERIRTGANKLRAQGADYLAYSLIDAVVDSYFAVLEKLGEDIEYLEDDLIANPGQDALHHIHNLKHQMIYLRKSVWPLREVIAALERGESPLIKEATMIYLRDVYDHTIQVIDTIETLRDMLSGMLDIYLSSISNRMNEVMKVLTIIATIFIPLTFIVGIYGMNFRYMPELDSRWAYPAVWVVMIVIVAFMLAYFRRRKWL